MSKFLDCLCVVVLIALAAAGARIAFTGFTIENRGTINITGAEIQRIFNDKWMENKK